MAYKMIGWTKRPEGVGAAMGLKMRETVKTLDEALQRWGAREVEPVIAYTGAFFDDPATDGDPGQPCLPDGKGGWKGLAISLRTAKRLGLITADEFKAARG